MAAQPGGASRTHFDTAQAARIIGLKPPRLRQCVRAGLVTPRRDGRGHLHFDFRDLILLRATRGLLEQRVPIKKIGGVLRSLRRQLGDRPLTRLTVYADGRRIVAWDGAERWQPESGQFLFNFKASQLAKQASKVKALRETPVRLPRLSADQWCDLAMEIEDTSPLEARAAYHHALDVEPDHAIARINLGRLLQADGNLVGAEAHYREALRYDPSCGVGWYNLAVLLEDSQRPEEAVGCYEDAVRVEPELADAHYNLGLLYERRGRHRDALRHLAIYRQLTRSR